MGICIIFTNPLFISFVLVFVEPTQKFASELIREKNQTPTKTLSYPASQCKLQSQVMQYFVIVPT